jgi:hypothetical protein
MSAPIETYVRQRASALGLSLSEVCRRSGMSRQTLYSLGQHGKLPTLSTVVNLADTLQVHPMRLLQLLFDELPLHHTPVLQALREDRSAFGRDVTVPDGSLVFQGEQFTKTWEIHNAGNVHWVDRVLRCMDDEIVVYSRSGEQLNLAPNLQPLVQHIPIPNTAPGKAVTLSVDFVAPMAPCTVLSYWKMCFADGRLCFPDSRGLWVKVTVNTLATSALAVQPAVFNS